MCMCRVPGKQDDMKEDRSRAFAPRNPGPVFYRHLMRSLCVLGYKISKASPAACFRAADKQGSLCPNQVLSCVWTPCVLELCTKIYFQAQGWHRAWGSLARDECCCYL